MKGFSGILSAAGLAATLALSGVPAMAQAPKQGAPAQGKQLAAFGRGSPLSPRRRGRAPPGVAAGEA